MGPGDPRRERDMPGRGREQECGEEPTGPAAPGTPQQRGSEHAKHPKHEHDRPGHEQALATHPERRRQQIVPERADVGWIVGERKLLPSDDAQRLKDVIALVRERRNRLVVWDPQRQGEQSQREQQRTVEPDMQALDLAQARRDIRAYLLHTPQTFSSDAVPGVSVSGRPAARASPVR